jgi:anthranilate synthase component 2
MLLLIDNYDSFVWNLSRYFVEMGCRTEVVRNDRVTVDDVCRMQPRAIVISPGPSTPREAGVSVPLIREMAASTPILGVCLGHQAIAAAWGGAVVRAATPVHGRTSFVYHGGERLFDGLPSPLRATRYHSLVVPAETLPADLVPTARTEDGTVMAIEHRTLPVFGVQFHPESVLTEGGHRLLANFLALAHVEVAACPSGDFVGPPEEQPTAAPDWAAARPLHW